MVTVAAGKKPRLELGVIGLSIGQTQSTGSTSRVNEAQLSGLEILELIDHVGEMLRENGEGFRVRFEHRYGEPMEFSKEHAALDAIKIARMGDKGMRANAALQKIGMFEHDGNLRQVAEMAEKMKEEEISFEPPIMEAFAMAARLHDQSSKLYAYASNVSKIVNFLSELTDLKPADKTYPFAMAALKRLGLR
jgi:hypothetical protein